VWREVRWVSLSRGKSRSGARVEVKERCVHEREKKSLIKGGLPQSK